MEGAAGAHLDPVNGFVFITEPVWWHTDDQHIHGPIG